jgi:hypothetical protein
VLDQLSEVLPLASSRHLASPGSLCNKLQTAGDVSAAVATVRKMTGADSNHPHRSTHPSLESGQPRPGWPSAPPPPYTAHPPVPSPATTPIPSHNPGRAVAPARRSPPPIPLPPRPASIVQPARPTGLGYTVPLAVSGSFTALFLVFAVLLLRKRRARSLKSGGLRDVAERAVEGFWTLAEQLLVQFGGWSTRPSGRQFTTTFSTALWPRSARTHRAPALRDLGATDGPS